MEVPVPGTIWTRRRFGRSPLRRDPASRPASGQALVEFALVAPLLVVLILAVIEFGWYVAVSTAVTAASREGARHGSTVGDNGAGTPNYVDCTGIRAAAQGTTGALITLTDPQIRISYDDGAGIPVSDPCPPHGTVGPDEGDLARFDRVVVEVTVAYRPITPIADLLVPTGSISAVDRRTIIKPSN